MSSRKVDKMKGFFSCVLLSWIALVSGSPNIVFVLMDDVGWADYGYNTGMVSVLKLFLTARLPCLYDMTWEL